MSTVFFFFSLDIEPGTEASMLNVKHLIPAFMGLAI